MFVRCRKCGSTKVESEPILPVLIPALRWMEYHCLDCGYRGVWLVRKPTEKKPEE